MPETVSQYWRRVRKRAWQDACADFGFGSRVAVVLKLTAAAAVIGALLLWGSSDAGSDELIVRGTLAVVIVLGFPSIFIFRLLTAPSALANEAAAERVRLESVVDDKDQKKLVANELSEMLSEAIHSLLNRHPVSDDEVGQLEEDFSTWCNNVGDKIESASSLAMRHHFDRIGRVEKIKFGHSISPQHAHILRMLSMKMDRLRDIIKEFW